ncbi:MAG: hypothetical protein ACLQSX_00855 [Smithella sp.]
MPYIPRQVWSDLPTRNGHWSRTSLFHCASCLKRTVNKFMRDVTASQKENCHEQA